MSKSKTDFDVGIIGGGPAGSGLASYLSMAGINCVIFEKELFPRPHVGESLVPASTRVFKELNFLEQMEKNKFPHKYGAVWTTAHNNELYEHDWEGLTINSEADIRFEERKQAGVDQNYTYHVDRGKFDLLLLQHAQKLGARVYEGASVKRVEFSNHGYPEIRYSNGKAENKMRVKIVVDASGRRTFLANQLKLKIKDPVFDQYAIHTWFDGFDRGHDKFKDYIFIHFLPISNTWIWQIPISDSVTSVGVVTQKKNFAKSKESREKFFWECVATREEFSEKLHQAKQMRPFSEEGDYSYATRQICGDNFVLIGDAARFVDPIFSSGVSIALNSSRFVSKDIIAALEKGDFSKQSFSDYETTTRRGMKNWYEFISLYYRLNVLYTAFLKDPRYRMGILQLLQGDVYDEGEHPVLARMKEIVTSVEKNKNHLLHGLLGNLTSDAFKPAF